MEPKKLYKTVETIASQNFPYTKEMLISVINELINNYTINITGGRIWELDNERGAYGLLFQTGEVDMIDPDFSIQIDHYPIFEQIAKERTVVDSETDMILRSKGILKYSASGVGEKIKFNSKFYYEYIITISSSVVCSNHYNFKCIHIFFKS